MDTVRLSCKLSCISMLRIYVLRRPFRVHVPRVEGSSLVVWKWRPGKGIVRSNTPSARSHRRDWQFAACSDGHARLMFC